MRVDMNEKEELRVFYFMMFLVFGPCGVKRDARGDEKKSGERRY